MTSGAAGQDTMLGETSHRHNIPRSQWLLFRQQMGILVLKSKARVSLARFCMSKIERDGCLIEGPYQLRQDLPVTAGFGVSKIEQDICY